MFVGNISESIPVVLSPWVAKGTIWRMFKDTPQEFIITDSIETMREAMIRGELAMDDMFLRSCGIQGGVSL